ncbi:hypothetical protein [Mucilaginibacter sp. UYCu711]|uniref:hypothetical protein n=1 Tax=Mucilaginibacter sp. UYCu711 TaxID=3156339 RepID=UPI003D1FA8D2
MKIKNTFVLLATFVALLTACKKSGNNTGDTPAKKLKYLSQMTTVQGTSTIITTYTYDDKNRVSTVQNGTSTSTYSYNGNNLFSVEDLTPSTGFRQVTEYAYNNDGSISSTHARIYRNNALSNDITYTYLVVNGRITERHYDLYVDKYTYDNKGNVISFYSQQSGLTTVNTYDDKLNKYTNGFLNPNGFSFTPNNLASSTSAIAYTYTYTYDADGYPTGAVIEGPPGNTVKYTYTYTER